MKIVERKCKDLISAEYNPRKLSKDQRSNLKDSLLRFGLVDPVIVNKHKDRKDIIVGGHQRLKVWSGDLEHDTVPTVEVNLSLEQERELNVRLNKNTGEFDSELLAEYYNQEELIEWGFDEGDLNFFEGESLEAEEDDYQVPDEIITDIVLGDLFEIGEHRLLCGSSTETDTWSRLMNDELCDMVVTDPPYNVNYEGSNGLTIENDNMDDTSFYQFLYDFYTSLGSYTKPGGAWYVWHADLEGHNFRKAFMDADLKISSTLIWKKNSLVMGRSDYHWQHEPCLYGWREGAAHNWHSDRKQTTILEFDKPSRNGDHPTMKPVELISYQINNSSKQSELVCDGFLGSGTTMVASHQLKRKCYGMELDPKYCQVIIDRMMKLDSNLVVKRNGEPYTNTNG